jgi:hypothetical protein
MSFNYGEADTQKLELKMKSKGFRDDIKASSTIARNLLNKVQVMDNVVKSYGKVPDCEYDKVVNDMPFYADIQELAGLIPVLQRTSQILDKMQTYSMSFPYPTPRKSGKAAQDSVPALPVDSTQVDNAALETEDEDENDEIEERLGMYRNDMVEKGYSSFIINGAIDDLRSQMKNGTGPFYAAFGGDGNPGPIPAAMKPAPPAPVLGGGGAGSIPVDIKPVPPAPVLGGGGAGLVPEGNKRSFNALLAGLTSEIAGGREKKQARVMPQAPLEASAQVKKEPGLSAAQIAQAATDNAARQGLSETVDLVSSDDE